VSLPPEVFFVRGATGSADPNPAEGWLNLHCRVTSETRLLPDPASHFKARFLPELGELPWRIRAVDYSCAAGTRTPFGNNSTH
jgi:hypothetical protein